MLGTLEQGLGDEHMAGNLVIRDRLVACLEDVEVVEAGQVVGVKVSHLAN